MRGLSPVLLLVESVSFDDVLFLLALPAARFIISAAVLLALTSNPLAIVPAAGNTGLLLPVYQRYKHGYSQSHSNAIDILKIHAMLCHRRWW